MPDRPLDRLLTQLEAAKSRYGHAQSAQTERLLRQISRCEFHASRSLLRFHEALLSLRAFPQGPRVARRAAKLLDSFHQRVTRLRRRGIDMSVFDDFDSSGLAGTAMQDTLTFDVTRWLARRIPRHVEIAWDDHDDERAFGSTLPRFLPLLAEDADVEANIPWRQWFDAARRRDRKLRISELEWLIRRFEQLPVTERECCELYNSLHLPIRWHLANLRFSRTRNWTRPRRFYYHTEPLIPRSQVSLARELARPGLKLTRLSRREGEAVLHRVREVMAVRYRELYGTTLGDPASVVRADLGASDAGRGIVIHLWNLPPDRRLPLRAYVAGFTLKNGVPINYVEAIGLCEWIEVGFNTFYTYRQGETAWIYAQALRCLHALTGATTISVYPYQIGQGNDEALDSGAFWFYRKLGFRSGRRDLERLAKREEERIADNPRYRTSRSILQRLAEAHVFLELPDCSRAATELDSPAREWRVKGKYNESRRDGTEQAQGSPGPWDTFSTRNLGLRVNRRMAEEFGGDLGRLRQASAKEIARALAVNSARWTPLEQRTFHNWALVLALIPNLARWTPKEKDGLASLIRAQAGPDEMRYLRLTQRHPRLRAELLRLGSGAH